MATIANLNVILNLEDNAFQRGLQNSRDKLDSWGSSLRNIGTKMTAGVTAPLVLAGGAMVNWASDLDESINKVNVLFDGAAGTVLDFSETTATGLGMSQQASLDFSAAFAGMLKPVAANSAELANMSTEMTQLVGDFASFNNLAPEEAFTVLSSAMAGETEAIRKYGVDVSAAAVETKALEMGLAATSGELTEQDKLLARYELIMEQTTDAQGDFARTQDSTSNKMKIFKARVQDLGASFGRLLLPYVNKALDAFSGLMDWLGKLDGGTRKWVLGIAAAAAAMGPLLLVLGMLLPGLSALLGLFGAILSPIGLVVAALVALAAVFRDDIIDAVQTAVEWFTDFVTSSQNVQDMVGNLVDAFDAFKAGDFGEAFAAVGRAAGNLWGAIQEAVAQIDWGSIGQSLLDGLASLASFVAGFVLNLGSIAVSVAGWLWNQVVDLWDGLVSWAVGLVPAGESVNIGTVAAAIAGWAFNAARDLWDALTSWAIGGTKGDGTGGATASAVGGITLGSVFVSVGEWAKDTIPDMAETILGWIGTVTVKIANGYWNLAVGKPNVESDLESLVMMALEETIGRTVYYALKLSIEVTEYAVENPGTVTAGALAAIAALFTVKGAMKAIPVLFRIAPALGGITAGILLTPLAFQAIKGYFEEHPLQAVEVLTPIQAVLQAPVKGLDDLQTAIESEYIIWKDRLQLPDIEVNAPKISWPSWDVDWRDIPFVSDIISAVNAITIFMRNPFGFVSWRPSLPSISWPSLDVNWEDWPFVSDIKDQIDGFVSWIKDPWPDISISAPDINWPFFGGDRDEASPVHEGSEDVEPVAVPEPGGFGGNKIAQTFRDIAAAAGLAALAIPPVTLALNGTGTTIPIISAVGTTSQTSFGQASSAGSLMASALLPTFSSIASSAGSNFGSVAGSAVTHFSAMRNTGTSNASGMSTSVTSSLSSMANQAGSNLGRMAGNALTNFSNMRSNASVAGSGIASAISTGTANAANAAGQQLGRIPGIVSGVGATAAGNAYSAGANISNSMASGMESALGRIRAAGAAMGQAANDAVAALLKISSPSKVFMALGAYVGEGFALGIVGSSRDVARASEAMVAIPEGRIPGLPQLSGDGVAGGVHNHYYYSVTPDDLRRLIEDAKAGGTFARNFGGELAMMGGQG